MARERERGRDVKLGKEAREAEVVGCECRLNNMLNNFPVSVSWIMDIYMLSIKYCNMPKLL